MNESSVLSQACVRLRYRIVDSLLLQRYLQQRKDYLHSIRPHAANCQDQRYTTLLRSQELSELMTLKYGEGVTLCFLLLTSSEFLRFQSLLGIVLT